MSDAMQGPDLDRPLRAALPRLRKATAVDGTMGAPVTLGGRRLVVTGLHGMLTSTMLGLVATPGVGAGGRALQLGRPFAVDGYLQSSSVSHHFDRKVRIEHVHGCFTVPVRVGQETRAVLYGVTRSAASLGDRVLNAASAVGDRVAREIAVELEVTRRMRAIAQHGRHVEDLRRPGVDPREICEELMAIAGITTDQAVRDRLQTLSDRVAEPVGPSREHAPRLTTRERDVLTEIALGHTNLEVADRLAVMPTTVKSYLQSVMRKLGTRNRVETVRAARLAGLLT